MSGPILWIVDSGPGRLAALSLDDPSWDKAMRELKALGILIIGLLPDSTSVTAVIDDLFSPFKQIIWVATQKIFAAKVKAQAVSRIDFDWLETARNVVRTKNRWEIFVKMEKHEISLVKH